MPRAEAEPFVRRARLRSGRALRLQAAEGDSSGRRRRDAFSRYAEDGAELVLALRMGPYVEVDYEELIQHHLDKPLPRDHGGRFRGCRARACSC